MATETEQILEPKLQSVKHHLPAENLHFNDNHIEEIKTYTSPNSLPVMPSSLVSNYSLDGPTNITYHLPKEIFDKSIQPEETFEITKSPSFALIHKPFQKTSLPLSFDLQSVTVEEKGKNLKP